MENCRFCNIVNDVNGAHKIENTVIAEVENYFAISSIGALVEGWTLVIPKKHCCSMKELYSCAEFQKFAKNIVRALSDCYGSVIAFEHGPNREGSDTSCGTDHAHIHFVPYRSIVSTLNTMDMEWNVCRASEVSSIVGDNEYLFYCDVDGTWEDPLGQVHILKAPISQFFRQVIARDQGNIEKFNYKTNPDSTLTIKTIDRLRTYFAEQSGGLNA